MVTEGRAVTARGWESGHWPRRGSKELSEVMGHPCDDCRDGWLHGGYLRRHSLNCMLKTGEFTTIGRLSHFS